MARLRTETAPEITVNDESVVFKAASGATAPLIEFKNSSGDVVGNIAANGVMNVVSVNASNAGTTSTDLATRGYVDNLFAGVNWHDPVALATIAALPTCNYNNGTDGVGATLTATANAELTIDSGTVSVGYSILVKNQADAKQNGIYSVTATGAVDAVWVLTRRADSDNSPAGEVQVGDACFVIGGSVNVNTGFILTGTATGAGDSIVFGTDNLSYAQFTGTGAFTAGDGLVISNSSVNVVTANSSRIVVNADSIDLANVSQTNTNTGASTNFINEVSLDSYGRVTGVHKSDVSFSGYATLANPTFTGAPLAPTANVNTNNTQIATTAFVLAQITDDAIVKTAANAKGDIFTATANDTPAILTVGGDGYRLAANSSAETGLSWEVYNLDSLSDVAINTPSSDHFLRYNGSAWVNANAKEILNLTDLLDVNITSASTDQFLKYNGSAWVNDLIDLGTDTTGNYVSNVSSGTGITVTHTPGEGSSASIAINTAVTADLTTAQTLANKTFTTPDIGVATATSVNKLIITAPETSATLTLANGSSFITSGAFNTTVTATANTSVTFPTTGTLYGTASGSITSSQIATSVSDETGTGNLVFSDSPVLVSPNIGTPSFGNLTSATGLPISTGVSGLGTGVATFLATPSSANLISALTDETGTGLAVFNTSPDINTSITTSSATFNLINTNVTTLNFAGSATTLAIGNTSGNTTLNGNVVVGGSLTVNGANTIINANTLVVADKNIQMANLEVQTNTTADGGGILLHGATDKTFYWYDASAAWTSSEHLDLVSGKVYKINNANVLTSTTLGSSVTGSSLTSFGTSPTLTTPIISSGGATFNGSTSGTVLLVANAIAGTTTITLPATTGTAVTTGDNGTVTSTMIANSTIVNNDISASAAIELSKLATSTAGNIIVYNASGVPTSVTETGDVTISDTGVTAIASGVIVNADISANAAIDQGKIADLTLNQQTTSYTLVLTDKNKMVEISNASATTLTVPSNANVAFPVGSTLTILQTGSGQTTLTPQSGVTINATPGLKLRTQWSSATIIKRATDTWVALGDLAA